MTPVSAYVFVTVYIAVDILYITLARPAYDRAVKNISGEPIPVGRSGAVVAAALSYACMALGWLLLVVPTVKYMIASGTAKWMAGLVAGVVYGLALYGVFNGSLYAMFRGWSTSIVTQDMLWGVSWSTLVTVAFAMTR